MEAVKESLASAYRELSTDELIRMHRAGTLTDEAHEVLESELLSRGVSGPPRPKIPPISQKLAWPSTLRAHWEGHARLSSAFWSLLVLGGTVVNLLSGVLVALLTVVDLPALLVLPIHAIIVIGWLAFWVFAFVSVWKCAWNSTWQGWGYLARFVLVWYPALILFGFISIGTSYYELYSSEPYRLAKAFLEESPEVLAVLGEIDTIQMESYSLSAIQNPGRLDRAKLKFLVRGDATAEALIDLKQIHGDWQIYCAKLRLSDKSRVMLTPKCD